MLACPIIVDILQKTMYGNKKESLLTALAVVGQYPGGRVIHVAAGPGPVGHPEVLDHPGLTGIMLLEDLPIEQV